MLKPSVLALAAALVLSACATAAGPSPQLAGVYEAVVADPRRPADEVARDPFRHPAAMLAFAGIEPGDKVADIRPGAGYFTRLFAPVVGDAGKVYAFVPNRTAERENPRADALVTAWPNVVRVNGDLNTLSFPEPLDVVWMSQEYHDFHIPAFNTDVALMNRAIFDALKPGGRLRLRWRNHGAGEPRRRPHRQRLRRGHPRPHRPVRLPLPQAGLIPALHDRRI